MADERTPVEQALDLLVFAPIGLVITARDELPRLVEMGRARVSGQVASAKVVGKLAVRQGRRQAEKAAARAVSAIDDLGARSSPPPRPPAPSRDAARPPTPRKQAAAAKATPGARRAPAHLAIPGYDTLAASQVVQRLPGLGPEELEAVRTHESAHRGRRTILAKIDQLQSRP